MRRILLLATVLITLTCSAHHINALGWCANGKAIFQTSAFGNNLDVQIELIKQGPNVLLETFSTPINGSTVKIITVSQPNRFVPIQIRFRYRIHNSGNWGDWSENTTSSSLLYVGCNALPLRVKVDRAVWESTTTISIDLEVYESQGSTQLKFWLASSNQKIIYTPAIITIPELTILGKYIAKLSYVNKTWTVNSFKPYN